LEAHVLATLRERGLGSDILFSSFRPSVLARLREQSPDARVALLLSPRDSRHGKRMTPGRAIETALALGAEALNPHFVQADADLVGRAHDAGLSVNVYTVDPPDLMEQMIDLGVDGLFTNLPDRLRGILANRA
jgi:glycerophosphoryl diester phosphodiesterase